MGTGIAAIGLITAIVTFVTASRRMDRRERLLRDARRPIADEATQQEIDNALGYDE